jgi:hypothetical protein
MTATDHKANPRLKALLTDIIQHLDIFLFNVGCDLNFSNYELMVEDYFEINVLYEFITVI